MDNSRVMNLIRQRQSDSSNVIGYTEYELKKIEALYNISINGQFRDFMLLAGRCSGGVLNDDPIILYRPSWSVRTQIMFQSKLFDELQSIGAFDFLGKILCFSLESETQYYFLITKKMNDLVYHYNENTEKVECTNLNFFEYLDVVYKEYEENLNREQIICRGELLEIFV